MSAFSIVAGKLFYPPPQGASKADSGMRNALIRPGNALQAIRYLPPLEIKSLCGSIARSAVISFAYMSVCSYTLHSFSLAGHELLPAVDIVGRARKGCVNHDVYG